MAKDKKDTVNKLLLFEPNPDNNEIIPNENLNISVNLTTTRKGRSVISIPATGVGKINNNQTDSSTSIGFIDGSKIGDKKRALTTIYTEANSELSLNGENDLESLGIDNINIEFDTAYTPMIKIKFIDIRGQAVFQQGTDSKYKMFFELPYPIFDLTVKGFFGKPVKYCLHMVKWNSSFNSATGNFEIDAEFIGYTYALLTDLLMGLIRAVVYTEEGIPIFNDYKEEWAKSGKVLKTIDEMLGDIQRLGDEFDKIKQDDSKLVELQSSNEVFDIIDIIKVNLTELTNVIVDGKDNFFNDKSGILGTDVKKYESDIVTAAISRFKEKNKSDLELLNKKILDDNLKLDIDEINKLRITRGITVKHLKNQVTAVESMFDGTIAQTNPSSYDEGGETTEGSPNFNYVGDMMNIVIANLSPVISTLSPSVEVVIYDVTASFNELNRVKKSLQDHNKNLREEIGNELRETAKEKLNFDPTIYNMFLILTVHCEVLLKTISNVSKDAEKNSGRFNVLNKLTNDLDSDKIKRIFAWPEYRKDKNGEGYEETWLGDDLNSGEALKVNEIVFIEHLLEQLMNLVKRDDELVNIGTGGSTTPQFWPVSTLDVPIKSNSLITKTPYTEALKGAGTKTTPQEATRCLLMRGFLGLGLANKHTLKDIDIQQKGDFEAHNLYDTIKNDIERIYARDIIGSINLLGGTGSSFSATDAANALIEKWKVGYPTEVTNPTPGATPLLKEVSDSYEYTYIRGGVLDQGSDRRAYIPISGNFDGRDFFKLEDNKYVMKSYAETLELRNKTLFTGSKVNDGANSTVISGKFAFPDDGSVYLKIMSLDEYISNSNNPQYGGEGYDKYKKNIPSPTFIKQSSLKIPTYYPNETFGIEQIDAYGGIYKTLDIEGLLYDGPSGDQKQDAIHYYLPGDTSTILGNVLCAYWSQFHKLDALSPTGVNKPWYYCGSYLAKSEPSKTDWLKPDSYSFGNNSTINALRDFPDKYGFTRELIGNIYGDGLPGEDIKDSVYIPYIEFSVSNHEDEPRHHFSLFGSKFYYQQTDKKARAFLFLHSFPWQGLIGDIGDTLTKFEDQTDVSMFDMWDNFGSDYDLFGNIFATKPGAEDDTYTIKGLYRNNGSFIRAPRLWCAFLGALLYRYDHSHDLIKTTISSFAWQDSGSYVPKFNELLYDTRAQSRAGMNFMMDGNDRGGIDRDDEEAEESYASIEVTLTGLPVQVRDEFKRIFIEFVDGDFTKVQEEFELVDTAFQLETKWGELWGKQKHGSEIPEEDSLGVSTRAGFRSEQNEGYKENVNFEKNFIQIQDLLDVFPTKINALKNYEKVTAASDYPWNESGVKTGKMSQLNLEMNNGKGNMLLKKLMGDVLVINNAVPKVFDSALRIGAYGFTDPGNTSALINPNRGIEVKQKDMKLYLTSFFTKFKELTADWSANVDNTNDDIQQRIFNTIDDDTIKLNLYRTIASIHNKWVAGTDNPFDNCGFNNNYDEKVANNKRGSSNVHLIDSFRFLDRAFNDIGDDFIINPLAISDMIVGNYNQSFFDIANKTLIDNNFNFIALPTYVNFNDDQELADMFKPYQYKDINTASGPSFVCVYVGQTSKHLDLGEDSDYPDDGIVVKVDSNGKYIGGAPSDFINVKEDNGSLNIPFFLVSYGQQNQSFFKDIKLDQKEFVETAESLQIIEDISQQGDNRKPNYNGQNLFNVYQTRSYSAEVEMMGNAMIQPMMYFQLNNIPMFRGAYMIIKTSHHITSHNMVTKFTGVRVKRTKTPLVEASTIFMNLLGSLDAISEGGTIGGDTTSSGGRDVDFASEPNPGGIII